jgi:hypothetical protein
VIRRILYPQLVPQPDNSSLTIICVVAAVSEPCCRSFLVFFVIAFLFSRVFFLASHDNYIVRYALVMFWFC